MTQSEFDRLCGISEDLTPETKQQVLAPPAKGAQKYRV
jgi:hypothetical protein